jgi:hypothetical protein
MTHSQYRHFPSRTEEGAKVVVLPAGDHDRMGCFTDQVKLTHALVRDLDEAVKEVKLVGEHEEESREKITELEALCKKLRQDTHRIEEEKATLEGMVESPIELLMEITRETGLDHMGEDVEDEEEDDDADDGGDVAAPPAAAPPPLAPPAAAPEGIDDEGHVEMIPEQEALVPHEVILAYAEPEIPQLRLYQALMRDYEESPPRMTDDFDDLDDDPNEGTPTWMSGFPKMGVMIGIESSSLSLKLRFKFLGFA